MSLTMETERLILRPLDDTDFDFVSGLYGDPVVMEYIHEPFSKEEIRSAWSHIIARGAWGKIGGWCLLEKETGNRIGDVVLMPLSIDQPYPAWDKVIWDEKPTDDVEIGYELTPSAWGKGYATEACKRLLQHAFEDLDLEEVCAVTDPEHKASQHVLIKAGLKHEGTRRAYASDDCAGFRITAEEWKAQKA